MPRSRPGWGDPCNPTGGFHRVVLNNGVTFTVAARIAELVTWLGNETLSRGYVIRPSDTGGYNCRQINGTDSWSNHAWALAVDINWTTNPWQSPLTTDVPAWMVDLWTAHGFRWGGHYTGTPDAMHWEFMGTPADADRYTAAIHGGNADGYDPPDSYGDYPDLVGKPWLHVGDTGAHVRYVQDVLHLETGLTVNADGVFGAETDRAVRKVQEWNHLVVDGWVGPATWIVIDSYATG